MTPKEAVADALHDYLHDDGYNVAPRLIAAEAAIEALRKRAMHRIKLWTVEDQINLYGRETALIDAILGEPPE